MTEHRPPAAVGGTDGGGAANGAYRGPPGLRPPLTKRLRPGHWVAIDCVIAALFAVVFLVGRRLPPTGSPRGWRTCWHW